LAATLFANRAAIRGDIRQRRLHEQRGGSEDVELEAGTRLEAPLGFRVAAAFVAAGELVSQTGVRAKVPEHVETSASHQVEAVGLGGIDRERQRGQSDAGGHGRIRVEEQTFPHALETGQSPFGPEPQHAAELVPADRDAQQRRALVADVAECSRRVAGSGAQSDVEAAVPEQRTVAEPVEPLVQALEPGVDFREPRVRRIQLFAQRREFGAGSRQRIGECTDPGFQCRVARVGRRIRGLERVKTRLVLGGHCFERVDSQNR
jgi:hypothetical protein